MKANLTIVMYHYVRAIKKSRYPNIKGLEFSSFKQQIGYMKRFYEFVTIDDCLSHYAGGKKLPKNAALLTFDDGYSDHFLNVFPVLNELNIQGCFFPVANSAINGKILDVNKIQLLLAAHPNHMGLLTETYKLLDICRAEGCLKQSNSSLFEELGVQSEWDPPEVNFIKRLFQYKLEGEVRDSLLDTLFKKYVSEDEAAIAGELYMNLDQLKMMARNGMYIGHHGYSHVWMNKVTHDQQKRELDLGLEFLGRVGMPVENWIICYPYGEYDDYTLSESVKSGCAMGFTSQVGLADLNFDERMLLPRLDTNHLPKDSKEDPCTWTKKIFEMH